MIETIICAVVFAILISAACTMFCKDAIDGEEAGVDWGRER